METKLERGAGILCHISSLPNKYGIGSLGKEAYEFADFLKRSHVKYWQILPLMQTGFGNSPYSSVACNSGNPYFIDLEQLKDDGLLDEEELKVCEMPIADVNYDALYETRLTILRLAYARFNIRDKEFTDFIASGEFEDYALFMSLKSMYPGTFDTFPDAYKYSEELAMREFRRSVYKSEYLFWLFLQFTFKKQWKKLKEYVNSLGIKIIGDMPLYVAYDSADVWAHPDLFQLDDRLIPTSVAGVPPDYFSKNGQLWGNPLYNWEVMADNDYEWWANRIKHASEMFDVLRLDHFRGFDRYWSIPYGSETAANGRWLDGPKSRLFSRVLKYIETMPIIAEDLGVMDAGVMLLRNRTGFPGMKILLFAFDGKSNNPYLPQNINPDSVAYTGTHDNATTLGLLKRMTDIQFKLFKKRLREALKQEGVVRAFATREEAALALCECTLACPSNLAILPIQDLIGLDDEARMNYPSTTEGNWKFRLKQIPTRYHAAVMRKMVDAYKRN